VTAAGAAGLGAKVALVEKRLMGGDCLNVGCVPSKALLRAARAAADVRSAGQYGVRVPTGVAVDFPAVMERMRRLRAQISPHDSARRFQELGVDVFLGEGRFNAPDAIEVAGQTLQFKKAVIATGSRPAAPPIPGLAEAGYLMNETVFSLTELPRRLAVVGAGPIGCELSQAFARFGSEVFLIEALHGILPKEDADAAEIVKQALFSDGIKLMCCGKDLRISKAGGGKRLTVASHGEHYNLTVDEILVGVGRAPNVEGLGLEAAGVAYDKSGVKVNDRLRTSNRHIYAAGDICSTYQFTHAADALARIVIQNALFLGRARASALTMPWCTYTDPEVAHVGLYEYQAEEQGIPVQTFVQKLEDVDRAILEGETEGYVKVHVRKGKEQILGATIVARHAGEMISELTLAIVGRLGFENPGTDHPPLPHAGRRDQESGRRLQPHPADPICAMAFPEMALLEGLRRTCKRRASRTYWMLIPRRGNRKQPGYSRRRRIQGLGIVRRSIIIRRAVRTGIIQGIVGIRIIDRVIVGIITRIGSCNWVAGKRLGICCAGIGSPDPRGTAAPPGPSASGGREASDPK
jgi:pyruvate/2-oxoglutarate dehydrogenase complex dihydrolipoamide dehydrogenase (E3) component